MAESLSWFVSLFFLLMVPQVISVYSNVISNQTNPTTTTATESSYHHEHHHHISPRSGVKRIFRRDGKHLILVMYTCSIEVVLGSLFCFLFSPSLVLVSVC